MLICYYSRLDFNGFYTEKLEALSAEKAALDNSTHSSESGNQSALFL